MKKMTRKIMRKVDNESENDQDNTKEVHTDDSDEKTENTALPSQEES